MYIQTNKETCDEIKKILLEQSDKPHHVRVFLAGMACSGPNFGLGLDNVSDADYTEEIEGVNFVIDKQTFDSLGEIKVEWMGNGYAVRPVNFTPPSCGSCSSCG